MPWMDVCTRWYVVCLSLFKGVVHPDRCRSSGLSPCSSLFTAGFFIRAWGKLPGSGYAFGTLTKHGPKQEEPKAQKVGPG